MEEIKLITIEQISNEYGVPLSFMEALEEIQLIEVEILNELKYIRESNLHEVEKLIRLHFELNINLEGLDVINNLLNQVKELQSENIQLRNRLKMYE